MHVWMPIWVGVCIHLLWGDMWIGESGWRGAIIERERRKERGGRERERREREREREAETGQWRERERRYKRTFIQVSHCTTLYTSISSVRTLAPSEPKTQGHSLPKIYFISFSLREKPRGLHDLCTVTISAIIMTVHSLLYWKPACINFSCKH